MLIDTYSLIKIRFLDFLYLPLSLAMTTQEQYIERLKELVTNEFGRQIMTPEDCMTLSNAVREAVGIAIDK